MKSIVHNADALEWLKQNSPLEECSIITSLPDISEFPNFSLTQWQEWFINAAQLVMASVPENGIIIFYQTDIKRDGVWVDKSFLCLKAAEKINVNLIARKVVCRSAPGTVSFGRANFSHLICFSKSIKPDLSQATIDVLPQAGESTWTRGMGREACRLACQFVQKHSPSKTILDPFCGHGLVLAVAQEMGFNAVGVELSRKRTKIAQQMLNAVAQKNNHHNNQQDNGPALI